MNPCRPKAMFQIIIGTRQALHVIALKEASRKVVSDVAKMLNGQTPPTSASRIPFLSIGLKVLVDLGLTACKAD